MTKLQLGSRPLAPEVANTLRPRVRRRYRLLAVACLWAFPVGCGDASGAGEIFLPSVRMGEVGDRGSVLFVSDDGSGLAKATTTAVIAALYQIAASMVVDSRLSADEWMAAVRDLNGHLLILDGLIGLYLGQVIAEEAVGGPLDEIQESYEKTALAAHIDFDAFLEVNRMEGLVVVDAEEAEGWIGSPDLARVEAERQADYDDDGDLDLYVVNAPGGDNALSEPAPLLALSTRDVDGDGELELGLTEVPNAPPAALIDLLAPAIQKVGAAE